MKVELKELRAQAVRAYLQDGLVELAVGFVLVWWAGTFFAELFSETGMTAFCWMPWVLLWPAVLAAKRRLTYPRVGRVEVIFDRQTKLMALALAGVVAGLAVAMFLGLALSADDPGRAQARQVAEMIFSNLAFILGIGLGGFLGLLALRYDIRRYRWLALVSLAAGVAFGLMDFGLWTPHPVPASWAAYFGAMAVAFLISGGVMLARLLKMRPLQEGGQEPLGADS